LCLIRHTNSFMYDGKRLFEVPHWFRSCFFAADHVLLNAYVCKSLS